MDIELCICTFRRPHIVETLRSVEAGRVPDDVSLTITVIDNDDVPSAEAMVAGTAAQMALPVRYIHAPGANISIARNAGLEAARADWLAFLDDDELEGPEWLAALIARQRETGADAVFGPSRAIYGDGAPDWMVQGDFHSQVVEPRDGVIQTGHTCNALLRCAGTGWAQERFDLARGKSGGEDTAFFFRLHRMGAEFAVAAEATVTEAVPPARATLPWLRQRRYRMGQSYSASATGAAARAKLFATAAVKAGYCHLVALATAHDPERRAFWLLRGALHLGVCAGCLRLPERTLYGDAGQ